MSYEHLDKIFIKKKIQFTGEREQLQDCTTTVFFSMGCQGNLYQWLESKTKLLIIFFLSL